MFMVIKYNVAGLIFALAGGFSNPFQGEFEVKYNDSNPFCASVIKPQSIEHIVTDGMFLKAMGFKNKQKINIKDIPEDKATKFIETKCYGIGAVGSAY